MGLAEFLKDAAATRPLALVPDDAPRYRAYTRRDLDHLPQLRRLSPAHRAEMKAVSAVIPFRVNGYVLDELIDWSDIPNDPIYQLTFPQPGMLEPQELGRMLDLVQRDAPRAEVQAAAREIQATLNPHPAGQQRLNAPTLDGRPVQGVQHKYRETVLSEMLRL